MKRRRRREKPARPFFPVLEAALCDSSRFQMAELRNLLAVSYDRHYAGGRSNLEVFFDLPTLGAWAESWCQP